MARETPWILLALALVALGISGVITAADTDEPPDSFWTRAAPALSPLDAWRARELVPPWPETGEQLWIELEERGRLRQWWIGLESIPEAEADVPANEARSTGDLVIFASNGERFVFRSAIEPVGARIIGPLEPGRSRVRDEQAQFGVLRDFLDIGLHRASETILVIRKNHRGDDNRSLSFSRQPFDPEVARRTQEMLDEFGITSAQLRSLAGSGQSLQSFFGTIERTPGLSEILRRMVKLPSLGAVFSGIQVDFRMVGEGVAAVTPSDLGIPGADAPLYRLPTVMMLNGRPSLNLTLFVGDPAETASLTAGVVALVAETPGRSDERRLVARLVRPTDRSGSNSR